MKNTWLIAIATSFLPALAAAQDLEAGRFVLDRTDGGIVRLDTRTGAMSLCQDKDGNLVCRMAADERAAYEEVLDRLEQRVTALEKRLTERPAGLSSRGEDMPTDEEVERSIGIMERFMRSFFGMVQEFKDEEEKTK